MRWGWRLRTAAVVAAWLLWAAAGSADPGERHDRQAVIDRGVAASALVTLERRGAVASSGSGVVIASGMDGAGIAVSYLLTTAHVLDERETAAIVVRFTGDAAGRAFPARLLRSGRPEELDLALLRVTGVAAPPAALETEATARLGEEVVIIGFPWGRRLGLYSGVVSQLPLETSDPALPLDGTASLMVDATVAKGVSGGGVFRLRSGGLVGIVEALQTTTVSVRGKTESYSVKVPAPGETFVVPLARIREFLRAAPAEMRMLRGAL
jgi:S1-C subfamily serine protease